MNGPTYPQFLCPNCRALSDLEAEVDEIVEAPEDWDEDLVEEEVPASRPDADIKTSASESATRQGPLSNGQAVSASSSIGLDLRNDSHGDLAAAIEAVSMRDDPERRHASTNKRQVTSQKPSEKSSKAVSGSVLASDGDDEEDGLVSSINHPNGIPIPSPNHREGVNQDGLNVEGPTTPRNDAGPFVFDGSGGLVESASSHAQPTT